MVTSAGLGAAASAKRRGGPGGGRHGTAEGAHLASGSPSPSDRLKWTNSTGSSMVTM